MSVLYIPECGKACFTIRKAPSGLMKDTLLQCRKAFPGRQIQPFVKDKTAKTLTDRHMRKHLKIRVFPSGKHFAPKKRIILRLENIFMRHATHIYAYLCSMMMLLRTHPSGTAFIRTAAPPPGRQRSLYIQTFTLSAYLPEIHSALIGEFLHAPC